MLTADEASRLTQRIQLELGSIAESTETVVDLIVQAQAGGAHQALHYASWPAYVADKFRSGLARLEKAERVRVVELLSAQGMSTRAIGSVVGASKDTVFRDLRAGVSSDTPAAAVDVEETSLPRASGEAAHRPVVTEAADEGVLCEEETEQDVVAITKVVGIDGKTYSRDRPRRRRREPLAETYRRIVGDLLQHVLQLESYHADDRYRKDREALGVCVDPLEECGSRLLELARALRGGVR